MRKTTAALMAVALAFPALPIPAAAAAGPGVVGEVPHFTNITTSAGLGTPATALTATDIIRETNNAFINGGKGAAWFDYNNDGWEDLLIGGVHKRELYRNNGDETFTEVIASTGLAGTAYTMGVLTPDLTNDGLPDVVFVDWFNRSEIFLNRGNGTFENVTRGWNFLIQGPSTGIAFGDLDGDGWGDLYIGSYYKRTPYLLRNLQGKGLQDMGDVAGLRNLTDQTFQPLIFDYDLDGDLDIYEVNDFGPDALYRNDGNWTFTDVSAATGVAIPGDGMGAALGDLNGDGYQDIFITNFGQDSWMVYDPANGTYSDQIRFMNITDLEVGWGVQTMDFNNDGYLDLFVADGRVIQGQPPEADKFFINAGDNTFSQVEAEAGLKDWGINKGSAAADFNKDGTMDLWVANVAENSSLYRNEPGPNHWFEVSLTGVASVRQGVGARVLVGAGGRTFAHQVILGSSYLSQDSLIQHFGIGGATTVDRLTVEWPSGARQEFTNLSADQLVHITEYEGNAPVARPANVTGDAGVPVTLDGTNSTDDTRIVAWNWTFSAPYPNLTLNGSSPKITFYDGLNFTGTLKVTDAFGNWNAANFSIRIQPAGHPLVDLGPDLAVNQNDTVTLSATLKGPVQQPDYANTTFEWVITGPGGPWALSGRNVTHTFVLPGVYTVQVNATDQFGLWGLDELFVTTGDPEPPVIVFNPPASVPEDTLFTLDASLTTDNDPSFPGSGLFYWRLNGAQGQFEINTGAVADFTLRDPGAAHFDLEVTDASGNLASRSFIIEAIDGTPPRADGGSDRVVSAGSTVRLDGTNSSDNDPSLLARGTFEWTFEGPDGASRAYGPVTEFIAQSPGVTHVHLNVRDPSGNTAVPDDEFTITAIDTTAPTLQPLPDYDVTLGDPVTFAAGNVTDNDPSFATTATYLWQFRDGTALITLGGAVVNHTFVSTGAFRVDMSVRDAASNYARGNFTVRVSDRTAPVALASVANASFVGDSVELNGSASTDNVRIVSYVWTFEPAVEVEKLNGAQVRWTFTAAGNYTLTLTVEDAAGNAATAHFAIEIKPSPAPPPPPPPDHTGGNQSQAQPTDNTALSVVGAALVLAAAAAAVMLFRRWRREQA